MFTIVLRIFWRYLLANLGFMVIWNIIMTGSLFLALALPFAIPGSNYVKIIPLLLGFLTTAFLLAIGSRFAHTASEGERPEWKNFGRFFAKSWGDGLVCFFWFFILFVIVFNSVPFYLSQNNLFSWFSLALLAAGTVLGLLASQFYLAFRAVDDLKWTQTLKKSFVFLGENAGFAIVSALISGVFLFFSISTFSAVPGFFGILLFYQIALGARLKRYDWLDEHPEDRNKRLPWATILSDDEQKSLKAKKIRPLPPLNKR